MVILDTHILVWFLSSPHKLSDKARKKIEREIKSGKILISSISVWEIYMLVKKGRLKLNLDVDTWISKVEKLEFLEFVPVDNKIAAKSVSLPGPLHADPADRIIIATSLIEGVILITSDKKILDYTPVRAFW